MKRGRAGVARFLAHTSPSLALIVPLVPFTGLNGTSVIVALIIYSQVILVRNILAGLTGIDRALLERALAPQGRIRRAARAAEVAPAVQPAGAD